MDEQNLRIRLEALRMAQTVILAEVAKPKSANEILNLFVMVSENACEFYSSSVAGMIIGMIEYASHFPEDAQFEKLEHARKMLKDAELDFHDRALAKIVETVTASKLPNPFEVNAETRQAILKAMEGDHTEDGT